MALNTYSLDLESGSSQYASNTTTDAAVNLTGTYTVEAWVYLESTGIQQNIVQNIVTDANTYGGLYSLKVTTGNVVQLTTWNAGSSFLSITGTTVMTTGVWYHLAGVKRADDSWEVYLNGVSEATSSSTRALSTTGKTGIRIGANEGGVGTSTPNGGFADCLIDEVRLWNTARTTAQIADNKDNHIDPASSGLVCYYRFNNSYEDQTSNNYDLTATGSPVFSATVPFAGTADGPANLKTFNGLAAASIKTINGLAIASVKSVNGMI